MSRRTDGPMTRSDADSWDLASSVGATATMVAAARALASREPNPLIDDPFAAAAGARRRHRLLHPAASTARSTCRRRRGRRRASDEHGDGGAHAVLRRLLRRRRRRGGIRQAVILASGLDSRPYRLPWPEGTVVYEIDQPQVIEFKTTTMSRSGRRRPRNAARSASTCARTGRQRCAPAGLTTPCRPHGAPRACWSTCPRGAGPAVRQHHRAQRTWQPAGHRVPPRRGRGRRRALRPCGPSGRSTDSTSTSPSCSTRASAIPSSTTWASHGWQVSARPRPEVFAGYGREFPDTDELAPLRNSLAVIATRK